MKALCLGKWEDGMSPNGDFVWGAHAPSEPWFCFLCSGPGNQSGRKVLWTVCWVCRVSSTEKRLCSRKSAPFVRFSYKPCLITERESCVSELMTSLLEDLEQNSWLQFSIWAAVMNNLPLSHPVSPKFLELYGKSPKPRLMTCLLADLEQTLFSHPFICAMEMNNLSLSRCINMKDKHQVLCASWKKP